VNRIVVGLIDTPASRAALRWSAWQAAATGSLIEVVTCVRPMPIYLWSDLLIMSAPPPITIGALRDEADELQQRVLRQEFGPQFGAVPIRASVVADGPATGLPKAAEGADLLVVGRSPRRHWLRRSIADRCAASFEGPVVTVPADHRSNDDGTPEQIPLVLTLHDAEV
jgi:nucleotide-binding universal stress UspA family protein